MVFIGVNIINRALNDNLKILNITSSVEKYVTSERSEPLEQPGEILLAKYKKLPISTGSEKKYSFSFAMWIHHNYFSLEKLKKLIASATVLVPICSPDLR